MKGFFKSFLKNKKNGSSKYFPDTDALPKPPRDPFAEPISIPGRTQTASEESSSHRCDQTAENVNQNSLRINAPESNGSSMDAFPIVSQSSSAYSPQVSLPSSETTTESPSTSQPNSKPSIQIIVSNSSGFQIGDTFNLSLTDGGVVNFPSRGLGLTALGQSISRGIKPPPSPPQSQTLPKEGIEDVDDAITEDEIREISNYMEKNWRPFGLSIGMTDEEMESIRQENPWSHHIAVLEMLHTLLETYPDTSVGFIASRLLQTGHIKAVEKLELMRA